MSGHSTSRVAMLRRRLGATGDNYLQTQETDARGFEAVSREHPRMRVTLRQINAQLVGGPWI